MCPRLLNSWTAGVLEASLFLDWIILSSLEFSSIKGREGRQLITQSLNGEEGKGPTYSVAGPKLQDSEKLDQETRQK